MASTNDRRKGPLVALPPSSEQEMHELVQQDAEDRSGGIDDHVLPLRASTGDVQLMPLIGDGIGEAGQSGQQHQSRSRALAYAQRMQQEHAKYEVEHDMRALADQLVQIGYRIGIVRIPETDQLDDRRGDVDAQLSGHMDGLLGEHKDQDRTCYHGDPG